MRLIQYNFKTLKSQKINHNDKKIIIFVNISMIIYHLIVQVLSYLENENNLQTLNFRESLVVLYLILFVSVANYLDRHLRERIQNDLMLQKDLQLKNMENYSHHIEELYTEVRSFRHDYANILTTLKLGIEQNDIGIVKNVYHSVLKDSNKRFRNPKYDIGRLVHIKNDALKSLLAAKFAQAQEHNVSVSLEVPEDICPQGMELVDFITIVSILCDNAIEATTPTMTIAYVLSENKQVFSIENAIKEEHIDMSYIFDAGVSSKGSGRGIGLSNVLAILDRYPNVSLTSASQNYRFQHVLEIHLN
ncbi:sensor histidine kinase [Streptococcus anginosus]|uniref:sensor histidine kinase n=1 Tax=Streptococcus anginosus TaxID=1328 RepID=UPI001E5BD4FE|nr:GHKL domain-containing protein [Streptococcus anginosus]MDB8660302.1 GHKL domain-containing protein [Streptococcus anginosus]